MKISLNHSTNEQSNLYLRALYAKLRKEYGKCVWQFTPWKDGSKNTIHIGFIDIGAEDSLEVSITYKKNGVINNLTIQGNVTQYIDDQIHNLAINLKIEEELSEHIACATILTGLVPFSNINGTNYTITEGESNTSEIAIKIDAFDQSDAIVEANKYLQNICNLLSIFINSFVTIENIRLTKNFSPANISQKYSEDLDWIDGHPIENNKLVLANYQQGLIDNSLKDTIKSSYMKGCAHFNNAAHLFNGYHPNKAGDTATALYVSALEACSGLFETKTSSCGSCGQRMYSIRQRVLDLVAKHLPSNIVKFVDEHYASRSKYLHAGHCSSSNSYFGTSIPQLDPNSTSGCIQQASPLPINLRDYISYILRQIGADKELTIIKKT